MRLFLEKNEADRNVMRVNSEKQEKKSRSSCVQELDELREGQNYVNDADM